MLKSSNDLLEPDIRFRDFVFHSADTGEIRPLCMDDLRGMVAAIELGPHVPVAIRAQFDTARNAFVYSWFVYELATLAEQQCLATLEMALRQRRYPVAPPNTTRSPGLDTGSKAALTGSPACSLSDISGWRTGDLYPLAEGGRQFRRGAYWCSTGPGRGCGCRPTCSFS